MRNYIQDGDRITVVAPSALSAGDGVVVGDLFGVALTAAESGALVVIQITGVVRLAKAAGTINPGVRVFWQTSGGGRVTTTATGNRPIGFHVGRTANSGADGAAIEVLLTPAPIATA